MKKMLVAMAALAMVASPTFAQNLGVGIGNLGNAPYAGNWSSGIHGNHASPNRHRAVRQDPYGAYARTPGITNGYLWPGALYDAEGHFIDQNSPGRW